MLPLIKESETLDFQSSNSVWVDYGQLRTEIATLEDDRVMTKVADEDKNKKGFNPKPLTILKYFLTQGETVFSCRLISSGLKFCL